MKLTPKQKLANLLRNDLEGRSHQWLRAHRKDVRGAAFKLCMTEPYYVAAVTRERNIIRLLKSLGKYYAKDAKMRPLPWYDW